MVKTASSFSSGFTGKRVKKAAETLGIDGRIPYVSVPTSRFPGVTLRRRPFQGLAPDPEDA